MKTNYCSIKDTNNVLSNITVANCQTELKNNNLLKDPILSMCFPNGNISYDATTKQLTPLVALRMFSRIL